MEALKTTELVVDELIVSYEPEAIRYKQGDDKMLGFFVGLTMRATNGMADPRAVSMLIRHKLRGELS